MTIKLVMLIQIKLLRCF